MLADAFPLLSKIESPADLRALPRADLLHIGIPDRPIQHGSREDCLADAGLDLEALRARIGTWWRPMRPQMADAAG